ncbi:FYN-binding protein 2 isoform X2 [Pteropus medius]|uniref:FYN-binding protein 2 isoform X2 n=1 Tax=Pteropus vampyrus TaxID=132908 RepID=UPI00196A7A88|nr:FYN-binding protein 2 isoform X2 [Pteropus giganteus]
MKAAVRPAGGENAPAPGEGGAAAQVGQVLSLGSGVPRVAGSDCSLAGAGTTKRRLDHKIQLWEAGFVSQTLPRRKAMDGERLRNFKELQAKFQNLDIPSLPGPIKISAGVSQKGNVRSTQTTRTLANGKPFSSNYSQLPPYCSSGEPQPLKPQKMKFAQKSENHKCSNSLRPPGRSDGSAVNSQTASQLLNMDQLNAKTTSKEEIVTSSFRDKLWNWEKVSSQKNEMSSGFPLASCGSSIFHLEEQKSTGLSPEEPRKKLEIKGTQTPSKRHLMAQRKSRAASEVPTFLLAQHERKSLEHPSPERTPAANACQPIYEQELSSQAPEKQPDVKHHQLAKTKPLPSMDSLGPPPAKPPKPPAVNLQAFQRQTGVPKTYKEAVEEGYLPPERCCCSNRPHISSAEFEEPHNYEATISYLRHPDNSINLCTAKEIADSTYEVEIEELQKPWKNFLHQELSPKHEDEDKTMKEKEPSGLEPQKTAKDPHSNHLFKVGAYKGTPGKIQMTKGHGSRDSTLARKQDTVIDIQTKACPEDPKLARHFQGKSGYAEALEVTKETPSQGAFKPNSISEETYDDVEYSRRQGSKSDFSNSFASDNDENSEKTYDDVYKTKSNYSKMDSDGKETLKRLQRFFKKEKNRFKMKKTKSKENISAFSISLPDLEFRSQEVIIHDDVNINEKESKDEDKVKAWKPKFLVPKEKQEKTAEESESLSPRNFFRTKKQNLGKKRMEREKRFRERFEYDKEITVINTAVACSKNSRNGIYDLPITPGEELEVIDVTEENLVICRNSKGKYGYVLIEHLNFKHQG